MAAKKKSRRSGKARVIKKLPTANDRESTPNLWHDASLLRRLYNEEGKSQGEIAHQLGCSLVTINKAFKKAGIKAKRGRRPTSHLAKHGGRTSPQNAYPVRPSHRGTPDLRGLNIRDRLNELADMMERLGPSGREAVRNDLHNLIDRL